MRQRMVVIPSGFADMGRVIATVSRVADRGEQRRGWAKKKTATMAGKRNRSARVKAQQGQEPER